MQIIIFFSDILYAWDSLDVSELAVNIGENVTLSCFPDGVTPHEKVMWVKEDRSERLSHWWIQSDGSLTLPNVVRDDSGVYTCALEDQDASTDTESISGHDLAEEESAIRSKYKLIVRSKLKTFKIFETELKQAITIQIDLTSKPPLIGNCVVVYIF